MSKPIGYNIPQGVNEGAFLSDDLLVMLGDVFVGVTDAFGDDAKLYKIDIGKIIESVQAGGMVFSGQFVDKTDGEIFDFEINQETNQLGYKSSGEFLDRQSLAAFCDRSSTEEAEGDSSEDQSEQEGLRPYNLLLDAINDEASEAGQSPFGSKLRKDLDYLAALSAAMYHGAIGMEAQPLYAGLHSYAIKYALSGLQLFTQSIGSVEGLESELMAEQWVDEHGLDFASAVVKEFSSRRCERMRELIQAGDQTALEEIKGIVEEAIAMAMSCTVDLIKTVAEADDYKPGDVQVALAAAIEEYCPIDNSEGYHVSENPRNMASEWQQVTDHSGCSEDLSMEALGLPVAEHISANSDQGSAEKLSDCPTTEHVNGEAEDAERIFYVNVGEGPSRNWDDCRQFGFLAAGGGRKWSKQLEKIKIGDTVIAYLKGYGYVGIGKVTSTSTPATKFLVNGNLIKELPLINDTIRSIKRFSKENGEYLIGVAWQVAVPREQAAWKANAGLFTTALVCASLRNQSDTVSFVFDSLLPSQSRISNTKASQDQLSDADWETFSSSLIAFLRSNPEEIGNDELRANAATLHALCPGDLLAIEQSASVRSVINDELNHELTNACMRLIKAEDEILALFFIGISELGDMTDEILEQFLDLIDEGMNLSTLATEYVPHNAFEVNALMSLIYWPEMPDWARAHLATRNEVGLTSQDRDSFVEYLGCRDILGAETLLSICRDIAVAPDKYSTAFIKALRAFLTSDFEAISTYNSVPGALADHFDDLADHCIAECRKCLDLVETSEQEDLNKPVMASGSSPRLCGDELIAYIKELDGSDKEDLIRKTGYSLLLPDGSERLLFEEFYNALLQAKGYSVEAVDLNASSLELQQDDGNLQGKEDSGDMMSWQKAIEALSHDTDDDSFDVESRLDDLITSHWASEEEFGRFFIEVSANIYDESAVGYGSDVHLFGHEILYSFYPGTSLWDLWGKARKVKGTVDKLVQDLDCLPGSMSSIFNIIPAAYAADYNNQSLDTWLANVPTDYSHEDNEFFCTLIAVMEEYSMSPLEDIVRNIRSAPVLDELVFCAPELICSDRYLLESNLLANPSLSSEALNYIASLFLQTELPQGFSGKTQGDFGPVSVGSEDVAAFWLNYIEETDELSKDEIASLILQHPKCTPYLRHQIEAL